MNLQGTFGQVLLPESRTCAYNKTINVRTRDGKQHGTLTIDDFITKIDNNISNYK